MYRVEKVDAGELVDNRNEIVNMRFPLTHEKQGDVQLVRTLPQQNRLLFSSSFQLPVVLPVDKLAVNSVN